MLFIALSNVYFQKLENTKEGASSSPFMVNPIARDERQVLRGSKLRFTEDAWYNLDLVKKLVTTPNLITESISLGTSGPQKIVILYIEDIANAGIVKKSRPCKESAFLFYYRKV